MANIDELFDVFDEQPAFEDETPVNPIITTEETPKESEDENKSNAE